jgi:hypothetical protein
MPVFVLVLAIATAVVVFWAELAPIIRFFIRWRGWLIAAAAPAAAARDQRPVR